MAILAAVFAVLLIAAFLTLKIMFPAEKLKSMAQDYVKNNFHREITFSDVSFNLVGLTLNNLAVSENSSFSDGTFLKADQAVLKVALMPLLRKRVEIATVGLTGLQLNITKQKDGTFNFDDLLTNNNTDGKTSTSDSSSNSFAITAEHIYASDCRLYYKDVQQGMSTSVTKLNLDVHDFDLTHPFKLSLDFTTDYKDKTGMDVTIPFKTLLLVNLANLDMSKASVVVDSLNMNYKTVQFALQGKAENFQKPAVNLQGKISGLSNKAIADIAPDLPHFVLPDINFSAQANADLDASSASITQAKLSVGDSTVSAKGQTTWGEKSTTYNIQSVLNLNLTQLTGMTTLLDGYGMAGILTGNLTATDKNNGQDVRGTITLKNLGVKYDTLSLSEMNGVITLASLGQISSNKITGKLNNETFTSSFAYKDLGKVLDIVFNFDLSKLTLTAFPSSSSTEQTQTASGTTPSNGPETLFNITSNVKIGQISIPYFRSEGAQLTAQLKNASASMKQSNGTVNFTLQEGAITDLGNFTKDSKVIKILMLPLSLVNTVSSKLGVEIFPAADAQERGQIKFSSGSGTYVFTNGVMNIQETHFNSSVSDMTASGNINFPTDALDMRVKATVLTKQTPIVIKIGGTVSNPSGKLDVAQTAVSLVGGLLNYKTPTNVASSAENTAADATKSVANTGTDAVKTTVSAAADAVKSIGSLFKSNKSGKNE